MLIPFEVFLLIIIRKPTRSIQDISFFLRRKAGGDAAQRFSSSSLVLGTRPSLGGMLFPTERRRRWIPTEMVVTAAAKVPRKKQIKIYI